MAHHNTILVHISGRDAPGITAGLLDILAHGNARVLDMEQVVVRGRLTLDLLVDLSEEHQTLKDLLYFGWQGGINVEFEVVEDRPKSPPGARSAVTLLAPDLTSTALAAAATAIAGSGGNIDRIVRLSDYPVVSYELVVSGADFGRLREELLATSQEHRIDVAVQPEGLQRRSKRLVVLDVDSTLIQNEVIDLLAEEADQVETVRAITEQAMQGELDFEQAIRARVRTLRGLDRAALDRVADRIVLTPGARTFVRTLKRLGYEIALVSGGFDIFVAPLGSDLGVHHTFANRLEFDGDALTGELNGAIVDRAGKAELLRRIAAERGIPLEQTVAVGDGANDLDMLAAAGLGIAFNAKPVVRQAADTAVSVPYLDALLFVLGIRRDEVEAADAADPSFDGVSRRGPGEV
jgi:phosphoserine phosphatase